MDNHGRKLGRIAEGARTMKALFGILIAVGFLCVGIVQAEVIDGFAANQVVLWDSTDIFTDSTDVTLSSVLMMEQSSRLSVYYQAVSASGTPNIKLDMLQSYENTASKFATPDTTTTLRYSGGWYEIANVPAIADSLKDEIVHIKEIAPVPMRYLRLRVTGRDTNAPDTRVRVVLFAQPPVKVQ